MNFVLTKTKYPDRSFWNNKKHNCTDYQIWHVGIKPIYHQARNNNSQINHDIILGKNKTGFDVGLIFIFWLL